MQKVQEQAEAYLKKYLQSLTELQASQYTSFSADYFCDDQFNANLCAELIRNGDKSATCSLKSGYQMTGETIPSVGHLQVVTNWHGKPICIIKIDSVEECQFAEVTADFAFLEGEGDRSLAWWRKAHWDFFTKECAELNIVPNENMLLVLERFHVVYQ